MIESAQRIKQRQAWSQRRRRIVAFYRRHGAAATAGKYGISRARVYQIAALERGLA